MISHLILMRHGKSEWNDLGLWTGWTDIELIEAGRMEAREAAHTLRDIAIHAAHVSALRRARQTLDVVLDTLTMAHIPISSSSALNERHYGIYTGKNKWEVQKEIGLDVFQQIRRGWDTPIQGGETLKDVYHRVVPYYELQILPDVQNGKNVLVVAHGNSLRALVKYIENIHDDDIAHVELETGEIYLYGLNEDAVCVTKEIRKQASTGT